jgi:hypothetical protein
MPARLRPDGGETHDFRGFAPLLRRIADKVEALLAEKGYDVYAMREKRADAGIEAVTPAKRNRKDLLRMTLKSTNGATSRMPVQQTQKPATRCPPI